MLVAHGAGLSWGKIAKLQGISKGMAYHVAVEGYTPVDPVILAKVLGNHMTILVQKVYRDGAGRFIRPVPSISPE